MTTEIITNTPYPTISATKDKRSAYLISKAYASEQGELRQALQFNYHAIQFSKHGMANCESLFAEIFKADLTHFNLLGNALIRLGEDPIYTKNLYDKFGYFSASAVSYLNNPKQMILDAVACKIQSVALYEDLLKALKNNEVISLINYIKEEELSHLQALKSLKKNHRDRSVL